MPKNPFLLALLALELEALFLDLLKKERLLDLGLSGPYTFSKL